MKSDQYGRPIFDEKTLCDLYLQNPNIRLKNTLTEHSILFDPSLELNIIPELVEYHSSTVSLAEFDKSCQNKWFMPDEYKDLDIAKWILEQCKTEEELQRAGEELLLFQERNMFMLLKYLKYLIDQLRKNNIVWGVGRGSSVSSFVLFLIGVHKINSLYYDLDIHEFLK